MATKPTITRITDTFTTLTNNVNTISLDLGATGRLTTNEDSDAVSAINELELGLRGTSNNLVATDLAAYGITANNVVSALKELDSDLHGGGGGNVKADLTYTSYSQGSGNKSVVGAINAIDAFIGHDSSELPTTAKTIISAIKELDIDLHGAGGGSASSDLNTTANDVVAAINEIEAVFDASANEITAPDDFSIIATGDVTIDALGDIILDVDGSDVILKDDGVQFGALTNSSGNLVIKSGSTTVMTGDSSDASVTFAGKINPPSLSTAAQDVAAAINELNDSIGSGGLNTTASTLIGAINEHETDIGNMTFTGLTSTNISAAIRELRTDIGDVTAGNMGTTASNLTAAVFELEQEIDTLNTKVEPAQALTTTATTLSDAVNELDGEIGDSAMGTVATTVKGAIYEHEQLINTLNDSVGAGGLNTLAQTLVGGINELNDSIGSGGLNTSAQTLIGAINEHDTLLGDSAMGTVKATVTGAVAEHEVQINNIDSDVGTRSSLTTNNKTNLVAAINEHDTEIGSASLNTSATTLRGAINELHTEIGTAISGDNLTTGNIGASLNSLDSAVGDLTLFDGDNISDTRNVVYAINAVAADVGQLDSASSAADQRIGSLASLDAAFVGAERDSLVNAINALRADIPLIYDENGTLLN